VLQQDVLATGTLLRRRETRIVVAVVLHEEEGKIDLPTTTAMREPGRVEEAESVVVDRPIMNDEAARDVVLDPEATLPQTHPTPPVPTLEDEELRGVEGLAREGVGEDPAVKRRRHLAVAAETTADGHANSTATRITSTAADPIMARSESGGTKEPSIIRHWMAAAGAVGELVRGNMSRSTCPKLLLTRWRSHEGSPLGENATGMVVGGGARLGGVLADVVEALPPHHLPPRHRRRRRHGVPVDPKPVRDAPPESSAMTKPPTVVVGPAEQTEPR